MRSAQLTIAAALLLHAPLSQGRRVWSKLQLRFGAAGTSKYLLKEVFECCIRDFVSDRDRTTSAFDSSSSRRILSFIKTSTLRLPRSAVKRKIVRHTRTAGRQNGSGHTGVVACNLLTISKMRGCRSLAVISSKRH